MSTNVYHLPSQPPLAAADQREPLAQAVREVSGYIRGLNGKHRRAHSRVEELKSGDPSLRRKHPREPVAVPPRPVTFFSIEEAAPGPQTRQVRRA